jgi:hypothetical protein
VAYTFDVQDMQEKVPIKLDAVASRNSRKQDQISSRINLLTSIDKKG